jgi:putrescine transport system substrate-binding protein
MKILQIAAATLFTLLASPSVGQERVLNVFNWSDYIDPSVLAAFSKETGIRVIYDTYDSNERLETRLMAGNSGYDIVVPSATFMQRQIKAGIYQKLDRSKLKNAANIWKEIDVRLAQFDPGNEYAINYMWFTTGLAYNVDKIKIVLGKPQIESWDVLFEKSSLQKLADCGVYMLDSPEDMFAIAMTKLGTNPDDISRQNLQNATDLLGRMRPHIKKFHSSEYINALANGDICLAVAWAGDAYQARNRAREANNKIDIAYVIPREGTLMSLDNLVIPKDAKNVEAAYLFIDFLLRPDVAARNSTVTNFANGVLPSQKHLPAEILANPSIYPDQAMMQRIYSVQSRTSEIQRQIARSWIRVKTGR